MSLLSFLIAPIISFGGGVSSGGGESTVCLGDNAQIVPTINLPNGEQEHTRLFDFFEGDKLYDLSINRTSNTPYQEQLKSAVHKLFRATQMPKGYQGFQFSHPDIGKYFFYLSSDLDRNLSDVSELIKMFPIKSGITVEPIHDRKGAIDSKYCPAQPVAQYIYDGKGIIRKDIFDVFTETDKAGFYLHEYVYADFRTEELQKDSRRARLVVSHTFANNFDYTNVYDGIDLQNPPEESLACLGLSDSGTNKTIFLVYPSEYNNIFTVQFLYMGGYKVFSKKTIEVPRELFDVYLNKPAYPVGFGSTNRSNFEGGDNISFRANEYGAQIKTFIRGNYNWYPDVAPYEQRFICTSIKDALISQ